MISGNCFILLSGFKAELTDCFSEDYPQEK